VHRGLIPHPLAKGRANGGKVGSDESMLPPLTAWPIVRCETQIDELWRLKVEAGTINCSAKRDRAISGMNP